MISVDFWEKRYLKIQKDLINSTIAWYVRLESSEELVFRPLKIDSLIKIDSLNY